MNNSDESKMNSANRIFLIEYFVTPPDPFIMFGTDRIFQNIWFLKQYGGTKFRTIFPCVDGKRSSQEDGTQRQTDKQMDRQRKKADSTLFSTGEQ